MSEKQVVSHSVTYRTADENDDGQRLDNYLARILKGVPRSMLYRILRRGEVRVNKGRVTPSYKLKKGDTIRIPPVKVPCYYSFFKFTSSAGFKKSHSF